MKYMSEKAQIHYHFVLTQMEASDRQAKLRVNLSRNLIGILIILCCVEECWSHKSYNFGSKFNGVVLY
jgi:hypothetical protein